MLMTRNDKRIDKEIERLATMQDEAMELKAALIIADRLASEVLEVLDDAIAGGVSAWITKSRLKAIARDIQRAEKRKIENVIFSEILTEIKKVMEHFYNGDLRSFQKTSEELDERLNDKINKLARHRRKIIKDLKTTLSRIQYYILAS